MNDAPAIILSIFVILIIITIIVGLSLADGGVTYGNYLSCGGLITLFIMFIICALYTTFGPEKKQAKIK